MNKIASTLFLLLSFCAFGQIPNPVDYYPFTNGSITGLTQNGTAMTQTTDRINSTTDAVSLNGDYLTRAAFNYQSLSVSFWVNTTTVDGNERVIIKQSSGGKGWFSYLKNGKAGFAGSYEHGQQVNGVNQQFYTGFSYIESTTNIADGQWHNIIVTAAKSIYFDGAGWVKSYTYKLFVDGTQENATTVLRGSSGSNTNVYADLCWNIPVSIAMVSATKYTDDIDDIRFYGSVVDAAGIDALSNENNCVTAQNVTFNPTTNSVAVSWDANADAISWDAVIVAEGANINTGTPVTGITTNSYTFSGLTDNTGYDVYIKANCNGFSGWYGLPQNFTTVCLSTSVTAVAQNVNLTLDANGDAMVTAAAVNNGSVTSCGLPASVSLDNNFFDCSNIGANTVTLTATDGFGNSSTATATVNVFPAVVSQNITAYLDENGTVAIDPASVDNGTNNLCSSNLNFSLNQTIFDCTDLGANNVVLTADDGNGVSRTANAVITIVDTIAPVVNTQNISVNLNAFFTATITAAQLNNGSTDNCSSNLTFSASRLNFSCEDQGVNTVILTVTDEHGNSASDTAYVTVSDLVMDQTVTAAQTNFCNSGSASTTISIGSSETGVKYYLRDANNNIVDGPVNGTGSALTFNTGTITSAETYHVYGEKRAAISNNFALDFDGANDVVHTTFKLPSSMAFTIEASVLPRSTNYDRIVSNYTNGTTGQFVLDTYNTADNGKALRLYLIGPGNVSHSVSVANVLTSNAWNHVAATFQNGLIKLYVNGIEVASSQAPFSTFPQHTNFISLGEDPVQGGAAEYLNGKLDEVRFWNYARSQSIIDAEQQKCLTGLENGLLALYTFENGTGTTLTDLIGAKNGVLTNMDPVNDWVAGAYVCENFCGSEMSQQITVSLGQTYNLTETVNVCSGSSHTFPDGTSTSNIIASLTHTSNLQTVNACDSIIVTTVNVNQSYQLTENVSVCAPATYTFHDGTVVSGVMNDISHTSVLQTSLGCDSTIVTNLSVIPNYNLSETVMICSGGSHSFPDGTFMAGITASLSHTSIVQSQYGCDSIIVTQVDVLPVYNLTEAATICSGSDYTFPDGTTATNITQTTIHTSSLQTVNLCDSIIITTLTVNPVYNLVESAVICVGSDYTFPDGTTMTNLTSQTIYTSHLQAQSGCDSIIVTTVEIQNISNPAETVSVCSGSSYTFHDGVTEFNITTNMVHFSNLLSSLGCDSVIVTNVEVKQTYSQTENVSICSGSSYTFPDGTTITDINTALSHTSMLQTVEACDSIIVTNVALLPSYSLNEAISICSGASHTFPDGTTENNILGSLSHTSSFTAVNGCDSLIVTQVTVLPVYQFTESVSVCIGSAYTFPDGVVETNIVNAVTHTSTLISSQGCDSLIVTTLVPSSINNEITLSGNTLIATQTGASYQWIDCATSLPIQDATSQSFLPQVNGSYACIIGFNSCSDTSDCQSVDLVGQVELGENAWSVYPNPTSDQVSVDGIHVLKKLSVYSLAGEKVLEIENSKTISFEELAEGSYILEIFDGVRHYREMVIKR